MTVGFFAAIGALAAYFARGRRIDVAIATLGLWLAATALLSVDNRPWIFWQAALGAVFGWAASGDRRFRPGSRAVFTIVAVGAPYRDPTLRDEFAVAGPIALHPRLGGDPNALASDPRAPRPFQRSVWPC